MGFGLWYWYSMFVPLIVWRSWRSAHTFQKDIQFLLWWCFLFLCLFPGSSGGEPVKTLPWLPEITQPEGLPEHHWQRPQVSGLNKPQKESSHQNYTCIHSDFCLQSLTALSGCLFQNLCLSVSEHWGPSLEWLQADHRCVSLTLWRPCHWLHMCVFWA